MKFLIMTGVSCLVAEQIAVCARVKETLVAFMVAFAKRKRDGAVRELCFDRTQQLAEQLIRVKAVFPALKNEGAKTKGIAFFTAFQNLLR